MEDVPLSLREQCFLHLVIHVMEFSPQEVALLPKQQRQKLLRTVAPVYLYCLEQTAVADGIDTDAIWNKINQRPEDCNTRFAWNPIRLLDSYKDGLAAQYLASVWAALLGVQEQGRVDYYSTLVKTIFSTHVSTLEESTADFLKSHKQPWFVPIVTNHQYAHQYFAVADWQTKSESEAAAHLIEIGALPTVLDLNLSKFRHCRLWTKRNNGVLEHLLREASVRKIRMDFSWDSSFVDLGKFVLQAVSQRTVPALESLEVPELQISVLSTLVPLFSTCNPDGYSGLKDLKLDLGRTTTTMHYPQLVSIIAHQAALESLDLSNLGLFPQNTEGKDFILALTSLFGQPQFRELRLCWCDGLPLVALQSLTEAFMLSSPQTEQHLTLVSMNIVIRPRSQLFCHSKKTSMSVDHSFLVGPKKHLCFQYTCIPCVFLEWFCRMKCIHLNTLEFIRCRTDTPSSTIKEYFKEHPNFNVQHFRCHERHTSRHHMTSHDTTPFTTSDIT